MQHTIKTPFAHGSGTRPHCFFANALQGGSIRSVKSSYVVAKESPSQTAYRFRMADQHQRHGCLFNLGLDDLLPSKTGRKCPRMAGAFRHSHHEAGPVAEQPEQALSCEVREVNTRKWPRAFILSTDREASS